MKEMPEVHTDIRVLEVAFRGVVRDPTKKRQLNGENGVLFSSEDE